MVVKYSRAQRRHDAARMYNRAVRKIREWEFDEEHLKWRACRIFNNMKNCSCWMCRNERTNGWNSNEMKLTMQERKARDSAKDSLEEYYD